MINRKLAVGLSLALLAACPSMIYAEDCCVPEYTPGEPLCDACAGYSQYAGVQLECGWDLFAYGEFLYWKPGISTSLVAEKIPANPVAQPQEILPFKFSFRPGFRIGFGMVAHCFDDWTFNVDYIRYHQAFSQRMSSNAPEFLVTILPMYYGLQIRSIRNKAHFHYDILGLNIQRPNYLGQRVLLSPFFGLKWLKRNVKLGQDLIALDGGFNTGQAIFKYTSIGIGAGFDGSWLLCWGLSLIGNADVGILYPYDRSFRQIQTPAVATTGNPDIVLTHRIKHLDIYAKGGMGLNWGSYFCCNRYHVNLSATYDLALDVVKFDGAASGLYGNGSVLLTGLSVRGQFDF
ncbi:MAG: hypothetical protein JSS30_01380 [Verrucomicrobia bacterium]|nr:hypothetical protein [Verrucomicrobiota bacterium]